MIKYIKDKLITWYTGLSTEDQLYKKWARKRILHRATTIENMFIHFTYIIPVTTRIFDEREPFGFVPNKEFQQYMYPKRKLGYNAVYHVARGIRDPYDGRFHFNDSGDSDQVFVATNNKNDAIMIALLWG